MINIKLTTLRYQPTSGAITGHPQDIQYNE